MNAPFPPGKAPLRVLIAAPRGFCAGVDRAIEIVERALQRFGAPVYVRHEIVHNRFVVDGLKAKGAVYLKQTPRDRGSSRQYGPENGTCGFPGTSTGSGKRTDQPRRWHPSSLRLRRTRRAVRAVPSIATPHKRCSAKAGRAAAY